MKVKKFGELNEKRSYGELSPGEKNLSNLGDEVYNAEGSIVGVEWRGKRRNPDSQVIKYMLDGELVETDAYELIDEFLDK